MNITRLYTEILPRAGAFLGVFFVVMVIGYGILYVIDFVPEEVTVEENEVSAMEAEEDSTDDLSLKKTNENYASNLDVDLNADPLPVSVTIDRLGRTVRVLNPTSRDIETLDEALLKGVVRHPDSADLSHKNGNLFILGHSSYINNVLNSNFQAFNGIQNLTWGDTIRVRSSNTEYIYQVDRVYQTKASVATIPTTVNGQKLTLATCDTFGAKEDRFIVEASLVSKKAL